MKKCKKCGNEIPEDSKYKRCDECRSRRWNRIKTIGKVAGGATLLGLAYALSSKDEDDEGSNTLIPIPLGNDRWCDECGTLMDFHEGDSSGDGYWECSECNNSITEEDIEYGYDEIEDDDYYNIEEFDDILDEPGCSACGNPAYPKCKASCPMFDE